MARPTASALPTALAPGGEVDLDADGVLAVQRHRLVLVPGAELDARDVAHLEDRAVRIGAHQDGAELLRIREPAGGADVELVGGVVARRLRPDAPERRDLVLRADGVHDVGRVRPSAVRRSVSNQMRMA